MSKPSITNCPNTFFRKVHSFNCIYSSLSCFACVQIRHTPLLGGYCGEVPPLPIPNREVKLTCADGTAMQCGRVGGCLLYLRSSRSNDFEDLFLCPYSFFCMRYTLLYTYLILYIVCCVIVIRNFVPPKYRKVKLPGQSWQSGYDKVVIPSYDKTCSHVLTNKHVLLFLCLTKKIALNRTYRTESYD